MKSKIDQIKELQELLLSEAITKDEFEKLKAEILNEKISEVKTENTSGEEVKKEVENKGLIKTKLEGFALATLLIGLAGFFAMNELQTIIRIALGVIAAIISYIRFKDSNKYHGNQIRIAGTIIVIINAIYYMMQLGYFD